jgi:hypothetical protein
LGLIDAGFDFDDVEGALDIGVLLDEAVDFAFEEAVCNPVSEDDFPHVDVLFVKGIVEFDTLQFIGALLPLLDEPIPILDVADLPREVLELLLPEISILVV